MAWAAIVATAVSAYASSREADDQREANRDDSIEMLRERMRLEDERAAANRARMSEGYNAWGAYGQGGAQGGMWGGADTPAASFNPGLLAPANFRQNNGFAPVAMPWGQQPPQQNNRGLR